MSRPPDEEHTRGFNTTGLGARPSSSSMSAVRIALGLFHTEGGQVVPLTVGAPVTVGRSAPSSHPIPDSHLSRVHARFTLLANGRVQVEDLGSTNGTWLAGRRIGAAEIGPGEAVQMGRVIAHVQPVGGAVAGAQESVAMVAGEALREVMEMATRAAASRIPIVILGETGTGKEVLARYIHEQSPRRAKPMVSVNCAAIPSQLVESTLFGHEKGAFTGAASQHEGIFEAADGGTVFLDEIGELPAAAQAALLRVLETRRFARVGSVREIEVDVRVVAATHRDLEAMVTQGAGQGAFRPDLYYRLGTITLSLPPLRARPDDIEPLARHFLRQAGGGRLLSSAAVARLRAYGWPGNVRELKNAVERALVVSRSSVIEEEDLPERVLRASAPATTTAMAPATLTDDDPFAITSQIAIDGPGQGDLRSHLHEQERRLLLSTYEATGYNRTETARRLGLPVRTLSHKMKLLGIKRPER